MGTHTTLRVFQKRNHPFHFSSLYFIRVLIKYFVLFSDEKYVQKQLIQYEISQFTKTTINSKEIVLFEFML